ncbi:MAG: fructokinase [Paenibacillaceae bacterium ZCTH02-B3]|nr:MAG: fructokinase [Paenibacillaceae bacterium ZCTH02-B3]
MFKLDQKIGLKEKPNDILTVGELLIDMISEAYDDMVDCNTYNRFLGGSAANLALNMKKLGLRPLVAAAVGRDGFGEFLIRQLEREGIPTDHIQWTDESTSMVVITKSRSTPQPVFYRGADFQLAFTPDLAETVRQSRIVHFSCWPISREPARSAVEQAIDLARSEGVLVGFDPNYHPAIWSKDEDGTAYVTSIIGRVDVIKPSKDDADRLFGTDTPENHLARFLELGAKLVILTLGAEGILVSNGADTRRLDSIATEVVDVTGAGDAFWAGFYAGLVRGFTLIGAVEFGMEVSAYKLRHLGPVSRYPEAYRLAGISHGGEKLRES